ncbi:MAG TPA: 50S ribosomal protein L29 [Candidatus Nanoarchaeia archaeon]|nr:50S ribosomal protein L29 [Candidatus Nanoarchaeia archaeon]
MKIMKDLKNLSPAGLQERLVEFKKELLKLNVQAATGANTANPGKLKKTKKNIARIMTLWNQKDGVKQ